MEFIKYNSIDNLTNKTIQKLQESESFKKYTGVNELWLVEQKIHGSNFQFTVNNGNVTCGSRNNYLNDDSSFFGFQDILKKYQSKIIQLYDCIIECIDSVNNTAKQNSIELTMPQKPHTITIYGQLFGGSYPGIKSEAKKVQRCIFYSPNVQFMAFDILVRSDQTNMYLNSLVCKELLNKFDIPFIPAIFKGTFEQCCKWSEEHKYDPSQIYKLFNLPQVENNIRQGHIIKHIHGYNVYNIGRLIFKDKNDKFLEDKGSKEFKVKTPIWSDLEQTHRDIIISKVNLNRFNNVVSKIGQYDIKMFSTILNMFSNDIMQELEKQNKQIIDHYGRDIINKCVNKIVSIFMKENKKEIF